MNILTSTPQTVVIRPAVNPRPRDAEAICV